MHVIVHDWTWVAFPSDLRSNAYKSLPGSQDVFSLSISCICISIGPLKSDLLS